MPRMSRITDRSPRRLLSARNHKGNCCVIAEESSMHEERIREIGFISGKSQFWLLTLRLPLQCLRPEMAAAEI
jgi:hypothetical protein